MGLQESTLPQCFNLIARYDTNGFRLGWRHHGMSGGGGGGCEGECNGTKRVKERESWNGQGGCCWPKWAICVCLRVCLRGYGKYMSGPIIPASLTSHGTLARWGQEGTQVSSCYSSTQTTHRVQPPSLMQTHPDLLSILQKTETQCLVQPSHRHSCGNPESSAESFRCSLWTLKLSCPTSLLSVPFFK